MLLEAGVRVPLLAGLCCGPDQHEGVEGDESLLLEGEGGASLLFAWALAQDARAASIGGAACANAAPMSQRSGVLAGSRARCGG